MNRGGFLAEVFAGRHWDYKPLSAQAFRRILEFDRAAGFGPGGTEPNRNRFYLYLVQSGSDVQVRTVAVKAASRREQPVAKEVARSSVDDPWIRILDLGFYGMCGYCVDWSHEGFCESPGWNYRGRWGVEPYSARCMWKINAPVVNPELLKRTRRFRWSDWQSSQAHILDYLKVFSAHPKIEFLSKQGLGSYSTKVALVRKLEADREFRRFFSLNAAEIRRRRIGVPTIMKAFGKGVSLDDARREIDARGEFRFCKLPRGICAVKAKEYVECRRIGRSAYADYLNNCQKLGLDLADTKVSFPKQFNRRRRIVQERVDALRMQEDAERRAEMERKLAAVAGEWGWLERLRGAFRIVVPRSADDLVAEGKAMANCLGDGRYAAKIAAGDFLVVFVRLSDRPAAAFVAAEYDLKRKTVTQCYGIKNGKPPKKVLDFVERAFAGAVAGQSKEAA